MHSPVNTRKFSHIHAKGFPGKILRMSAKTFLQLFTERFSSTKKIIWRPQKSVSRDNPFIFTMKRNPQAWHDAKKILRFFWSKPRKKKFHKSSWMKPLKLILALIYSAWKCWIASNFETCSAGEKRRENKSNDLSHNYYDRVLSNSINLESSLTLCHRSCIMDITKRLREIFSLKDHPISWPLGCCRLWAILGRNECQKSICLQK